VLNYELYNHLFFHQWQLDALNYKYEKQHFRVNFLSVHTHTCLNINWFFSLSAGFFVVKNIYVYIKNQTNIKKLLPDFHFMWIVNVIFNTANFFHSTFTNWSASMNEWMDVWMNLGMWRTFLIFLWFFNYWILFIFYQKFIWTKLSCIFGIFL
jgi:hypothetical protein